MKDDLAKKSTTESMNVIHPLDERVLRALCAFPGREELAAQIPHLQCRKREDTVVGFWSFLSPAPEAKPSKTIGTEQFGDVYGLSSEARSFIAFLMFVEDGFITSLEGLAPAEDRFPRNTDSIALFSQDGRPIQRPPAGGYSGPDFW